MVLNSIKRLRWKIDRIDQRIVDLLNHRAGVVLRVGKVKKNRQEDPYVPLREKAILEKLAKKNKGPFPTHALRSIYQEIFSASRSLQASIKVTFLGPQGTFTHMAALRQFGGSVELIPALSVVRVFDEVEHQRADYGLVPIENSTEGIVNATLDSFADSPLKICGEVVLPISHHLMSISGKASTIKKLYSHPQATGQCRLWLEENLPGVPIVDAASTASAAQKAAVDPEAAAIASEYAARVYQLKIVKRNIEDHANNWTRFVVISRKEVGRSKRDKTSLLFSVKDQPGILYKTLESFSKSKINLTKITSRPVKKKAWEYIFFIDLDGHIREPRLRGAVDSLARKCNYLKILGSYPKGT